ncbi:MAG: hypothetical protein EA402_02040 [Planctomycetota bacterium]|nr:MAG: hypothetical protein EA402_02040 [Planctomycetota bacterium]
MNPVINAFMTQITPPLSVDEEARLRFMCRYFARSNLWPSRWCRIEATGELIIYLANEAERFELTMSEMRTLYEGLQQGQAVDWAKLKRLR